MTAEVVNKWAAGANYGPVLSQTDLYLLKTPLELHPIMAGDDGGFQLLWNLSTGHTGGFNPEARDRDLAWTTKSQPATIPRVSQLYVITTLSPWCHLVRNDAGVTMEDICNQVTGDYAQPITDLELTALPARLQDQINRVATHRSREQAGAWYGTPNMGPPSRARIDWLRERFFFERLYLDDNYAKRRLGFSAPNIFVMDLTS